MRWWLRLLNKSRADKQLDSELRFHIERHIADNIAAGMSLEEARRLARLEFGSLDQVKEDCHGAHRGHFIDTLIQDVRYGLRALRKSPGYTAAGIITLALGIGANTAIFSMVDTIMFRPLPVRHPGELTFLVFPRDATHFDPSFSVSEFRELRDQTDGLFSDVDAMALGGFSGPAGHADGLTVDNVTRPAQTLFVTGHFFEMLGIRPYLGRFISPNEGDTPGSAVAVLSYRYWQKRFNGDAGVLNKTAFVNGRPVTIVGITPKGFLGLTPIVEMEAYLPLGMLTVETGGDTGLFSDPAVRRVLVVGRLGPAVQIERANAALGEIGRQLIKRYPRPGISGALLARQLRPPGLLDGPNPLPTLAGLFLTLAGLVFALACLNVANLSLVRAAGRQREMAVRAAIGGTRARLVRHLMSETVLLALLGALAGMAGGFFALRVLSSLFIVTELPLVFEFPFNGRVFLFGMGVALLAATLVGIIPALRVSRGNLSDILHEGGRTSTGRSQRTRMALVAAQVAGSLALLIVAGLFVRSLRSAQHSDLGFDADGVLNVALDPGEIGYTETQGAQFYTELLTRVRGLPGVQSASLATAVPLDNFPSDEIKVDGNVPQLGEQPHADYDGVSTGYFRTMSIPILRGRDFTNFDTASSPRVAIINQAMAERFWHGADPIGRSFNRIADQKHPIEIVGVVKNSRTEDPYSPIGPAFYTPATQSYSSAQTLQLRTLVPPESVAPEVLSVIRGIAPTAPVLSVRTMSDVVTNGPDGLLIFKIGAELTAALGLLGLVIGTVGIYGVMAYTVGHKTQEIGVRIALGAQRGSIVWMIARQGLRVIGIGLGLGLLISIGVGRLVGDFLVGIGPTDPVTYSFVSALLLVVALLACYVPVRRALQVDPMIALRHE